MVTEHFTFLLRTNFELIVLTLMGNNQLFTMSIRFQRNLGRQKGKSGPKLNTLVILAQDSMRNDDCNFEVNLGYVSMFRPSKL